MDKDQFLSILNNYTALTREEGVELISIQDRFPYSQVIHNLCSRAAQDLQLGNQDQLLHRSAIYATERSVLKAVMTAKRQPRETAKTVAEAVEETPVIHKAKAPATEEQTGATPAVTPAATETVSSEALRTDLIKDMKRLQEMKSRFEETMAKLGNKQEDAPPEESKRPVKETATPLPSEALIEEIKTKKKVKPEGPKQVEQNEIIDNFIKTQPSLPKVKPAKTPEEASDLAEESLSEGDHIVSETLVEILIKQGRKDKAIEVLKKLIWKIPQKKAYFAAQIEELKK